VKGHAAICLCYLCDLLFKGCFPSGTTSGFAICPSLNSDEPMICDEGPVGPDTFTKWRSIRTRATDFSAGVF
jgi:hypothetical protein